MLIMVLSFGDTQVLAPRLAKALLPLEKGRTSPEELPARRCHDNGAFIWPIHQWIRSYRRLVDHLSGHK